MAQEASKTAQMGPRGPQEDATKVLETVSRTWGFHVLFQVASPFPISCVFLHTRRAGLRVLSDGNVQPESDKSKQIQIPHPIGKAKYQPDAAFKPLQETLKTAPEGLQIPSRTPPRAQNLQKPEGNRTRLPSRRFASDGLLVPQDRPRESSRKPQDPPIGS